MPLAVTDASFEQEVLTSELPVLVDLYADWCQPCKVIAPIVEQIEREYEGRLRVVKVDTDKNPNVSRMFRVQSIPMLVVVAEGRVAGQLVGAVDKQRIVKMIEPVLPRPENEIQTRELAQLIQARQAVPVDIRDAGVFGRYRIPSAINVPADQLVARARELAPIDGRIRILYGRSTEEAKTAANDLNARGSQVGYLAGGFLHWEADGFPVERPD